MLTPKLPLPRLVLFCFLKLTSILHLGHYSILSQANSFLSSFFRLPILKLWQNKDFWVFRQFVPNWQIRHSGGSGDNDCGREVDGESVMVVVTSVLIFLLLRPSVCISKFPVPVPEFRRGRGGVQGGGAHYTLHPAHSPQQTAHCTLKTSRYPQHTTDWTWERWWQPVPWAPPVRGKFIRNSLNSLKQHYSLS